MTLFQDDDVKLGHVDAVDNNVTMMWTRFSATTPLKDTLVEGVHVVTVA